MLFCLLWPDEHSYGFAHTIKIKLKILCSCSFLHRQRDNGFSHHFQRSHDRVSAVWKFACNKHSAIRIRIPPHVLFGAILRLLGVVETSYMGSSQVFPPRHKLTPVRHNVTIKTSNKGSGEQFGKSSEITLIRLWKQKDLHKRKDQNVNKKCRLRDSNHTWFFAGFITSQSLPLGEDANDVGKRRQRGIHVMADMPAH